MAIDKLIPRYLNLDDDERLVKSMEMTDAKNVHISTDDDNNAGVVKQAFGNAQVSPATTADTVPSSGNNSILGTVSFDAEGVVFFFLFNSGNSHGVYMYMSERNVYVKIFENDALEFFENSHVQGEVVKTGKGETLLYFTDGLTEPKKINVTRFLTGRYESLVNDSTDTAVSNYITVCKRPPVIPPTFSFITSSEGSANNRVIDRAFQFACQYVYVDGEVSAISPYSKLTYSDDHFNVDGTMADLYFTTFDSIDVTLTKATDNSLGDMLDGDVKAVRFLARAGNSGSFVVFDEIRTNHEQPDVTSNFTNALAYRFVADQEVNKLYDAVPLKAKALCVSDNRLFFGNYVDGFDVPKWPETIDKSAELRTQSFPVTSGIATGSFTAAEGQYTVTTSLNGNETESGTAFSENITAGSSSESNLTHFSPSVNGTSLDYSGGHGYYGDQSQWEHGVAEDEYGHPKWHITSDGDTNLESGEHSGRIGSSSVQPLSVEIDLSSIPTEGFGVPVDLNLNYTVHYGRTYIVPTKSEREGAVRKEIKYKPAYGVFTPLNPNRDVNVDFLAGGDSYGENTFAAGSNGLFRRVASVCYVGDSEDFNGQSNISVGINVQSADTRETIAQKIRDAIYEDQTEIEISGNGGGTAHGNFFQFTAVNGAALLDERSNSENSRYYFKGLGSQTPSYIKLKPKQPTVLEQGAKIVVEYVGRAAYFEYHTVAHNGPMVTDRDVAFASQDIGIPGERNRQTIEGGPITFSLQEGQSGIDGDDAPNEQGDLYRTFCLNWGSESSTTEITVATGGGVLGSDVGDNRMTFRSGSHHPLGVVFYDHRNRSSSVNLLPESYVPFSGTPTSVVGNEVQQLVPYDIDVVFDDSYIPTWAERYQIVYPGNSLYESTLTHSVPEALVADMTKVVIRDPSFGDGENLEETLESSDAQGTDATAQTNFPSLAAAESAGIVSNALYIPFRFFEGKVDSYRESKGAKLNYEFRPGDKLRIVSYSAGDGEGPDIVFPNEFFFEIIDYKYFENNSDKNVLVLPNGEDGNFTSDGEYRRSGWMLIIKDNSRFVGFRAQDVRSSNAGAADRNYWNDNVVVEILRPKIQPDKDEVVYYEIGESYPVNDDSRLDSVYTADATNGPVAFVEPGIIQTKQRLFAGDTILPSSFPGSVGSGDDLEQFFGVGGFQSGASFSSGFTSHTVVRILGEFYQSTSSGGFTYYRYRVTPSSGQPLNGFTGSTSSYGEVTTASAFCTFSKPNAKAVHLGNQGDTYFRKRDMRASAYTTTGGYDPSDLSSSTSSNYRLTNIEDPGFNDFLPSTVTRNYHYGRPHVFNPDFRTSERGSSITYSDVYASDGELLALSSFNPSLFPFKDYSLRNGPIAKMYDEGSSIMVLQQRKVSRTPISRDYIQTAEGGMLITSQNVMGTETYLPSDYGPGMFSRGITEHDGIVYFTDVERGVVCAVSGGQLRVISDAKVSNFFAENLATVQSGNNVNGAILGIHPDQDELICSFQTFVRRSISSGGTTRGRTLPMAKSDNTKFDLSGLKLVYETAGSALDIVNESQTWNGHLLEWEEAGKGVIYTDSPTELGFIDSTVPLDKSAADLLVTNQRNDFFAKMTRTQGKQSLGTLDEGGSSGRGGSSDVQIQKSATSSSIDNNIAYNYKQGVWTTKYDFVPEGIAPCFENMVTFKNGVPWLHSPSASIASFYGVSNSVIVEVISKINPSMVKVYKALSLEGNSVWTASLSNREQASSITANMWKDQDIDGNVRAGDGFREGMLYCDMPGDTSSTSHLDEIVLGKVASGGVDVAGKITFVGRVNNIPFNRLDKIFKSDGTDTTRTVTSVDSRNTLNVSANTGISEGDVLIARPAVDSGFITGDHLRDYYLKIRLTNTDTSTRNELYAINAIFERSRLHNDRVN